MFQINSVVKKRKVRIWGTECPTDYNLTVLYSPGAIKLWAISIELVFPYFLRTILSLEKRTELC